jgi:hypothetical protein
VSGCVFLWDAAHQHDDLGQHQFGHRARIRIRRVEHGNAALTCCFEGHLIGANAKAANAGELVSRGQDGVGQLCSRTNAQEVDIFDLLGKRLGVNGLIDASTVGVAMGSQQIIGLGVDALQQ